MKERSWVRFCPTRHNKFQTALEDIKEPSHEVSKELKRRAKHQKK